MTATGRRVVAIVGRPNVGKSTLVNRIVGKRLAIVEERPGVTRDRKAFDTTWRGVSLSIVDTGGWLPGGDDLDTKVSRQSERAIGDAEVVVMVVDASVGVTEEDARVAGLLRTADRPVLLAVNKVDDVVHEAAQWEFLSLGLGDPHAVSALHGRGTGDLLDAIVAALPPAGVDHNGASVGDDRSDDVVPAADRIFSIAIVGRPNVGKSTLFNRLIGEDRSVVHDLPGTTRDSIDTVVETERGPIRFIDTAGMRRRGRVDEATEYYSVLRALRSIDEADIALLVIDATQGVTGQDQRLAERIDSAGCPMVVLLNKWELLDADARAAVTAELERKLYFIGSAPVLKISALTGKGVHKLLPALADSIDDYSVRVPTRQVNRVIMNAQAATPAPHGARVLYAMQGATDPPTFTIFANRKLPDHYLRYLERKLREEFDMGSTPIKMRVRRRNA
jgi:GTP-binding protein